jgi:hypothetical protein
METRILLDSSRGSILPLTSLALAVIESREIPVPHLIVEASGFAGNEIVIGVIGYDCANICSGNIKSKNVTIFFIAVMEPIYSCYQSSVVLNKAQYRLCISYV